MAYTPHSLVKPEKIVGIAAGLIDKQLTLSKLVTREAFDKFKGAKDDTLTYRLPGRLPFRKMPFRDARTNPLIFDVYKEATTTITWGGYIYNGVKITDEQAQFDAGKWAAFLAPQAEAVAAGINQEAAALVTGAPYEVFLKGIGANIRSAFGEAKKVLDRFGVPSSGRIAVVGTDVAQAMFEAKNLTIADYVGDVRADTALGEAIIGRLAGFTIVEDLTLNPQEVIWMVPTGFVQLLGAPLVPESVPFGSSTSLDGLALRWLRDYDMDYRTDRSLVDSWEGHNHVKDRFLPAPVLASADPHTPFDPATLKSYFVRGVRGTLAGVAADSIYPAHATGQKRPDHGTGAGGNADAAEVARVADLIAETGISSANKWTPPAL